MAKNKSKRRPTVRRTKASKAKVSKLPLGTFEEWLRSQPVKPAETKPEVPVPSGSYEEWISRRVRKELESQVEGTDS